MPSADCISAYSAETLLLLLLKAGAGSPTGTHEEVNGTVGSATSVNTYTEGSIVRLVAKNGSAGMVFGAGPATDDDVYLAPDVPEYFSINSDTVITVIGAKVDITVME